MTGYNAYELPDERQAAHRKAVKLEWWTIGFFATAVTAMYLALGSSQAMKAAWIEDMLAFVPPIAFLVADRIRFREPDDDYPYGYHRAVAIAFQAASVSLFLLGFFLLYDSVMKLIAFEHPPVGLVQPWGEPIWLGWFMIAALAYTMFPAVILGRMKLPLARELHDKTLFADAEMNKADWMTAGAGIVGVVGIYFGLWWLDGAAAIFIAMDIMRDGWKNMKAATSLLMDKRPVIVGEQQVDPLPARALTELKKLDWVKDARVRMREEGHVFFADAIVIPADSRNLPRRIRDATNQLLGLDWRLKDLVITIVDDFDRTLRDEDRTSSAGS